MIEKEIIEKILEAGVKAPSGSNSQPWEFKVKENEIEIFALPQKDHPVLNYRNRGTLVACGALIENIKIACDYFGIAYEFDFFPDRNNFNLVAKIRLQKSTRIETPLYKAIFSRITNRKPYKKNILSEDKKIEILKSVDGINGCALKLAESENDFKNLGESLSVNEIILFENEEMHRFFFEELVWTEKEEREKKNGLYLKTMELTPLQEILLKIFKNWKAMKFLNKLKIARFIAKENSKVYASAALMGAIIVNDSDKDFLQAGILMERIWLKSASMGLSFHLLTGIPFFYQRMKSGYQGFSKEQTGLIENAYANISDIFGNPSGIVALVFRIGEGETPSDHSSRKAPIYVK